MTPMIRTILTALCLAATCAVAGPAAAQEPARGAAGPVDAAPHVQQAAERDDDAVCSRARRRLWIEGEGWVVRRITTCR